MEKGGCLRRNNQGEGRAGRTYASDGDAPRPGFAERGGKVLRDAVDRAGTWRVVEQLQLAGKSPELETVSRGDAADVGPRAECGVRRCGRKHRICDGGASADPQEVLLRSS